MNYTKGQWEVQHSFNVFCGRRVIASCGGYADNWKVDEVHNENIANAKLIAAAPDMYEALEKIQEWLLFDKELTGKEVEFYNEQFTKANNLTIKALSKAKGIC